MEIWMTVKDQVVDDLEPMDIDDAEVSLKQAKENASMIDTTETKTSLLNHFRNSITDIFLEGIQNWTVDMRRIYLQGLESFLYLVQGPDSSAIPALLASLSSPIRDEEAAIRLAAEKICVALGRFVCNQDLLDLLLPKIRGEISGADTSSHSKSLVFLNASKLYDLTTIQRDECDSAFDTYIARFPQSSDHCG
jgi:hypothetical protein